MNIKRNDLKPCPFCGEDAFINHEVNHIGSYCTCSNKLCQMSKYFVVFNQWQDRSETKQQFTVSFEGSLWNRAFHEVVEEAKKSGRSEISFEEVDKRVLEKSKQIEVSESQYEDK